LNPDLALGGATLALAAGYYLLAAAIPTSLLADDVGPAGLPAIYALLLAALSVLLMVRSIRRGPAGASDRAVESEIGRRSRIARVAGLLGIGVAYVVVVPSLGYLLSIAVLIGGTTYYQGGVFNRYVVGVAVSGAVFLWLMFVVLLGIAQPPGWWPVPF